MIRADMIPDEVVEAAAKADYEMTRDEAQAHHGIMASLTYCPWGDLSADGQEYYKQYARASIAAALNAWPGVFLYPMNKTRLVLPLPQKEKGGQ